MHARIALAVLFLAGFTVACGDDDSAPTGPTPVAPRALDGLRITPADPEDDLVLSVGGSVVLTACADYSDDTENCAITATWESLDASIATVDDGTVTGVAPGEAQVRASY